MNVEYTDDYRHRIAKVQYRSYSNSDVGKTVKVQQSNGHKEPIGVLRRVITDDTGLKVYLLEDPKTGHINSIVSWVERSWGIRLKGKGEIFSVY